MYLVRVIRDGHKWSATVFEKNWSEALGANEVVIISQQRFLFRPSLDRWVKKEIWNDLLTTKKMEIIDG